MINKCLVCNKEFEALRKAKRTCSDACRQLLHREGAIVTKIVPIVTEKGSTVTEIPIVTNREVERKLVFTTEPIEERIKQYKDLYPNSTFVPNWVAHGFNSKEDAIKSALKEVQKNKGIIDMGLGND
jgi:hypothetical protein